jgi:hypothetical protein
MAPIRDVYSRITDKIIADLEQGVRPWLKPWNADHAAGRITRPLRHNGVPYKGINVVMLWSASVSKGYACPLWLSDFAGAPRQSICSRRQRRTRSLSAGRHGRGKSFRNERVVYPLPSANGSRLISFALDHLVCALIPRSDLNQIAPLAMERIASSKPSLARDAMRRSVR